ncbi:hypothetical protein ACHQM5_000336 [Ranunculus cassubicifolius]
MPVLALLVLLLAMTGYSEAGNFCVCRPDRSDAVQQNAIDYACGHGGSCAPISEGGACFRPNTVHSHCSYAVNSYYQSKRQGQGTCDFSGVAAIVSYDPSANGCTYPSCGDDCSYGGVSVTPRIPNPNPTREDPVGVRKTKGATKCVPVQGVAHTPP